MLYKNMDNIDKHGQIVVFDLRTSKFLMQNLYKCKDKSNSWEASKDNPKGNDIISS